MFNIFRSKKKKTKRRFELLLPSMTSLTTFLPSRSASAKHKKHKTNLQPVRKASIGEPLNFVHVNSSLEELKKYAVAKSGPEDVKDPFSDFVERFELYGPKPTPQHKISEVSVFEKQEDIGNEEVEEFKIEEDTKVTEEEEEKKQEEPFVDPNLVVTRTLDPSTNVGKIREFKKTHLKSKSEGLILGNFEDCESFLDTRFSTLTILNEGKVDREEKYNSIAKEIKRKNELLKKQKSLASMRSSLDDRKYYKKKIPESILMAGENDSYNLLPKVELLPLDFKFE